VTRPVRPPVLRVVRGRPTEEEVAALVVVLAARRPRHGAPPPPALDVWSDRAALLAVPARPGPVAWRASGLPR
jgi:hypothetical protein